MALFLDAKRPKDDGRWENALESDITSIEAAARVCGNVWVSFILTLIYLLITVGAISHLQLLLEAPVKLPFFGVSLSLAAFSSIAPCIFVVFHLYVLIQFSFLSKKLSRFECDLRRGKLPNDKQEAIRQRLPSNLFVQLASGDAGDNHSIMRVLLLAVQTATLLVLPLLLLWLFLFKILPYHSELGTWLQRLGILSDLLVLLYFWPHVSGARASMVTRAPPVPRALWFNAVIMCLARGRLTVPSIAVISLPVLLLAATFPGEWLDRFASSPKIPFHNTIIVPFRRWLVEGYTDMVREQPNSVFSNRLVIPNLNSDRARVLLGEGVRAISLRGRNLRSGIFADADFHNFDLHGADLRDSDLERANFSGMNLARVKPIDDYNEGETQPLKLSGSVLDGANFSEAILAQDQLTNVSISGTDFRLANLSLGSLQGCMGERPNFRGAQMNGSNLDGCRLTNAKFDGAVMEGVKTYGASLMNSSFILSDLASSQLNATDFRQADFTLSNLTGSTLFASDLTGAKLTLSSLSHASIWRAHYSNAQFASSFVQGLLLEPFTSSQIVVDRSGDLDWVKTAWFPDGYNRAKAWVQGEEPLGIFHGKLAASVLDAINPSDRPRQEARLETGELEGAITGDEVKFLQARSALIVPLLCGDVQGYYDLVQDSKYVAKNARFSEFALMTHLDVGGDNAQWVSSSLDSLDSSLDASSCKALHSRANKAAAN